jgi:hypothetical protein
MHNAQQFHDSRIVFLIRSRSIDFFFSPVECPHSRGSGISGSRGIVCNSVGYSELLRFDFRLLGVGFLRGQYG